MNTPRNRPPGDTQPADALDPRRSPLEADEAELARHLRALPAAGPSPALDARVLDMARAALQHGSTSAPAGRSRPRRPRPRLAWWLGTAAGAVLAAGVGWQLGLGPQGAQPGHTGTAPVLSERRERQSEVQEIEIVSVPRPAAAPASPAPPSSQAVAPAAAELQRARKAEPGSPPPAAASAPQPREHAPAPAPAPLTTPESSPPMSVATEAGEAASLAEDARTASALEGEPTLDQIVVTGARAGGAGAFPPVVQDFRLSPEDWLQRIRDRRDSGDLDSARRSAREFVRAHPQRVMPKDLRQLLNDTP